uniref:G-protein coupled receptors family 1 profile domain-containing protein n=1 Tax=Calidris pygmaea TaxID=425635 RepID=A0A8C3KI66_9CHAR
CNSLFLWRVLCVLLRFPVLQRALEEKLPQGWHAKDFVTPSQDLSGSRNVMMDSTKILGVQVVLIAAYSLIILLGFIGNSLVIYIIVKYKTMRTVTNFFIANLALADLMVDTLCLPFTLVYTLLDEWKFGAVLCHLVPYAQALSVHVSTLTLTVIALDRYRTRKFRPYLMNRSFLQSILPRNSPHVSTKVQDTRKCLCFKSSLNEWKEFNYYQ